MSNPTNSNTSVKVVTDAQEAEIRDVFKTLHHKVLQALTSIGVAPLFPVDFAKCGAEEYKNLHQQSRILVNAKTQHRWDTYIGAIKVEIGKVIEAHMVRARGAKDQLDAFRATMSEEMRAMLPAFSSTVKIPFSDLVGCWPKGKPEGEILAELDKLFSGKVAKGKDDKFFLTVPFTADTTVAAATTSTQEATKAA